MNPVDLIIRARSVIAKGCRYGLGHGGYNPALDHPWDNEMRCDCSGFVAWALRVSRHLDHPWYKEQNGGWLETSAIVRDCHTPFGFFTEVPPEAARPGDLIVYGDRPAGGQGHVGLISEIGRKGPAQAIHCSAGNEHRTGDAIQETGVAVWINAGGIIARHAEAA